MALFFRVGERHGHSTQKYVIEGFKGNLYYEELIREAGKWTSMRNVLAYYGKEKFLHG
jgi:hypothetical protein